MHVEDGFVINCFSSRIMVSKQLLTSDYDFIISSAIFDKFQESMKLVIERDSQYSINYENVIPLSGGNCKGLKLWKINIEHIEDHQIIEFDFREQKFESANKNSIIIV